MKSNNMAQATVSTKVALQFSH